MSKLTSVCNRALSLQQRAIDGTPVRSALRTNASTKFTTEFDQAIVRCGRKRRFAQLGSGRSTAAKFERRLPKWTSLSERDAANVGLEHQLTFDEESCRLHLVEAV